jgi:hypothetical protein
MIFVDVKFESLRQKKFKMFVLIKHETKNARKNVMHKGVQIRKMTNNEGWLLILITGEETEFRFAALYLC